MAQTSKKKFQLLLVLSLTMLLIILFFGLRGKDYHFSNDVSWLKDSSGLRFGNYGMAYAVIDQEQIKKTMSGMVESFSIETAVKAEKFKTQGFNIILSLHNGKDSDQLIVGQYQTYIVVMNSDDYAHTKKVKRMAAGIFSQPPKKVFLTITTGKAGTKLYVDGRLIQSKPDLILKIPTKHPLKMTLANTVYGGSPWRGEIYGLAFYPDELSPETVENHFKTWAEDRIFPSAGTDIPFLLFTFHERRGKQALDQVTGTQKLNIPACFHIPEKRFLSLPWKHFKANGSFFSDFIINLLGFLPLGFVLCALFIESGGILQKKAVWASVAVCFLISLCIEVAQAWIPSRNSQSLDLILNTTGGLMASIFYRRLYKTRERKQYAKNQKRVNP